MHSSIRSISSVGLWTCIAAAASAGGLAQGGSDNQTWILNMGSDVTYFTEPLVAILPSSLTGSGTAAGTVTTNMPTSGGIYYNTNSYAQVANFGTAYIESIEGNNYFFSNAGTSSETVELQWQGYVTTSSTASGTGQAWDYAASWLLDAETNNYAYDLEYESASAPGEMSYSGGGSGDYTFTLAPGQMNYQVQAVAYNEAEVLATPEPAPFAALGLGVLPLLGLRRRHRKASASR